MPSYATQQEFEAYVEGWTTSDPAALARLLERASRDVDSVLTAFSVESNGLRFGEIRTTNPKGLATWQADALSRATCAQAEYRNLQGEEFFVAYQHESVSGPEFSTKGRAPYIAPKVARELVATGLVLRGARAKP